jgi:hypothetical protein
MNDLPADTGRNVRFTPVTSLGLSGLWLLREAAHANLHLDEAAGMFAEAMKEQEGRERLLITEIVGIMQALGDPILSHRMLDALLRFSGHDPNTVASWVDGQ